MNRRFISVGVVAVLFVGAAFATASTCYLDVNPDNIPEVDTVPHEVDPKQAPLPSPFTSYTEYANFQRTLWGDPPLPPDAIVEPGGAAGDDSDAGAFDPDRIELVEEGTGIYRVYLDGQDFGTLESSGGDNSGRDLVVEPDGTWYWAEAGQ